MTQRMTAHDLARLVQRVFEPTEEDRGLAIIVDLPDARCPDNPEWQARRAMAADWASKLADVGPGIGLPRVSLAWYRNAGGNNADLPETCVISAEATVPDHADRLSGGETLTFADLFDTHSIVLAPTELSATAPLKLAVKERPFRAATMPGFLASMIPALKIDYTEVNRRCGILKDLLDAADTAIVVLRASGEEHELMLDLRHRHGTASGGLFPRNGAAGNLPSGETYIVPYEGEIEDDPSRSSGTLPVQFEDEVVVYRIVDNRAVEVLSQGRRSDVERRAVTDEPAYANLAELGLGVLDDFGLEPTGSILLDEKLGLHIAFGRSDHFGGQVSPADFSAPDKVVHIDRVYIEAIQPRVQVVSLTLDSPSGEREIMRDGRYCGVW